MAMTEEKVADILEKIAADNKLDIKIRAVVYRKDYQDYFIVVGKVHYCEIREKLFDVYSTVRDADALRELVFKLRHPVELDEWRKMELGIEDDDDFDGAANGKQKEKQQKIQVDKKDENDWV